MVLVAAIYNAPTTSNSHDVQVTAEGWEASLKDVMLEPVTTPPAAQR